MNSLIINSERKKKSPLAGHQNLIRDLDKKKDAILQYLFEELKMDPSTQISIVDLNSLDAKLNRYGFEIAFDKLLLNLIFFCGEYIREYFSSFGIRTCFY